MLMPPPTSSEFTRRKRPWSISAAFAVVPPMSKLSRLRSPRRRASSAAPTTPAAGPDSMMWIGRSAAAAALIAPPLDCMIVSGRAMPALGEPRVQSFEIAADQRQHVGC